MTQDNGGARALAKRLPHMGEKESQRAAAAILANGAVFKTAEEYEEILAYIDGLSTALSDLVLAVERRPPASAWFISELRAAHAALDGEAPVFLPDAAETEAEHERQSAAGTHLFDEGCRYCCAAELDRLRETNEGLYLAVQMTAKEQDRLRAALDTIVALTEGEPGPLLSNYRAEILSIARAAIQTEGSAGTRDWLAAHPEIDAALDRSLDEVEVEYAARRATEGSAGT